MNKCLRCGKCCFLPNGVKCRYLLFLDNGTTLCKIYPRRLNKIIATIDGVKYYCTERINLNKIIPSCPYNSN